VDGVEAVLLLGTGPARELADAVSSAEAVPGSGWVAAVSASLAAGLVAKSAARSEGWSGAEGAHAQAVDLRDRLLALADRDARAYERALTALERRGTNLARALESAAEAPVLIAETAGDVAELAAEASECADGAARADASAAAALAAGAAKAAAKLVSVNLATLPDDERLSRADRAAEASAEAAKRALAAQA
jgi:formiminotetrahydrofolate cyclodeaminase